MAVVCGGGDDRDGNGKGRHKCGVRVCARIVCVRALNAWLGVCVFGMLCACLSRRLGLTEIVA